MPAQTSYSINHARAFEGQLADLNFNRDTVSEPAGGIIPFGVVVQRNATTREVTVGGDALGIGVALRDLEQENGLGNVDPTYTDGDAVAILREGYVYVAVAGTGNIGDPLFYVDADGTIGTGTAAAGQTQIINATLEEVVAVTGEIAKIRLPSGAFNGLV